MKSKPYRYHKKLFRYDFDLAEVEYIFKADQEMIDEEIEWERKHGSQLFGIDEDGYVVTATVGLSERNWKNKAARDEYLFQWVAELEEEGAALMRNFMRYELPALKKEMEAKK